jgi:glycosyltransferase involved in cell wall biosynthesis
VIGCVGRFHTAKGQDNFVKAAAIVVQHYPRAKFLLVGADCDVNNAQLMTWLSKEGLQAHFVLLGERDDVPVCLSAMDIYCMPSRTEGFPNGLGEAMAMGLPCVATNVGDTAVLVGDTAVLVPPQNEQALAEGLLTLLALSKKQREYKGQYAKERVFSEFSIEKARARFDSVYQEIITGSQT